jgi:SpoVK/Ycf46/Vps4 family AAA+-type ATPase
MFIGDILVALDLVTPDDLTAARELQRAKGGLLGDRLLELGRISAEDLEAVINVAPASPRGIEETGTQLSTLLGLLVKAIYSASVETPSEIAELLKLPTAVVMELIEEAEQRQLVALVGAVRADVTSERVFALTKGGVEAAQAAMNRSEYVGPAPVSLDGFRLQITRQPITDERFDQTAIDDAFGDLVVSEDLFRKLGPAINSGASILLYGPPGNGKTSIAANIGSLFKDIVYVPHCFEVDGQIVKVFDPLVHRQVRDQADRPGDPLASDREYFDRRWEACRRPVVFVGGELTLEMLDLGYNAESRFYEAPLHIKALGGVLLIDDFGRQLVTPKALLNRWITPLESRRDHLKLSTGKSFSLPFDELVLFATNMSPRDLMDAAFLRRIPYKIEIPAPSVDTYRSIFNKVATDQGVQIPKEAISAVINQIGEWKNFPLAGYQPKFIIEQIRAACRFENIPWDVRPQYVEMALSNLHTRDPDEKPPLGATAAHRAPHASEASRRPVQ